MALLALPHDTLSRCVLLLGAPDAVAFAACSEDSRDAVDEGLAHGFVEILGAGGHAEEHNDNDNKHNSKHNNSSNNNSSRRLSCQQSRRRALMILDSARSNDTRQQRRTFLWAAGQPLPDFLRRLAHAWPERLATLLDSCDMPQGCARLSQSVTPLCRAAMSEQGDSLAELLRLGATPDKADSSGRTPLFWAARRGAVHLVTQLLDAGASPLTKFEKGDCALVAGLPRRPLARPTEGQLACLGLMLERLPPASLQASPEAGSTLMLACNIGCREYVDMLLTYGVDTTTAGLSWNAGVTRSQSRSRVAHHEVGEHAAAGGAAGPSRAPPPEARATPLLAAIFRGFGSIAADLLARDRSAQQSINATLSSGKTALHTAAEQGDALLCRTLLSAGALLDSRTSTGRSALHAAIDRGHAEVVEELCKYAQVPHLLHGSSSGLSPLLLAERRGSQAMLLPLLRCYQRSLRRHYMEGKEFGGPQDSVMDAHLTGLCLRHGDALFGRGALAVDIERASAAAQALALAKLRCLPSKCDLSGSSEKSESTLKKERPAQRPKSASRARPRSASLQGRTLLGGAAPQGTENMAECHSAKQDSRMQPPCPPVSKGQRNRPLSATPRQAPPRPRLLESIHPDMKLPPQKAASTSAFHRPPSTSASTPTPTSKCKTKTKSKSESVLLVAVAASSTLSERLAANRGTSLLAEEEALEGLMADFFEQSEESEGEENNDIHKVVWPEAGPNPNCISMYSDGSESEREA